MVIMKKSDLIAGLASIHDDELVMLKVGDQMFSIIGVEVQQEEPPLFGLVVTDDLGSDDFKRITDERQAVRDAEAERVRQAEAAAAEEAAKQQAAADAAAAKRAQEEAEIAAQIKADFDTRIEQLVAAKVAEALAAQPATVKEA